MSAVTTHAARFSILKLELPGDVVNAGILLEDPGSDRLYLRLRRDWDQLAPQEADLLSLLESDIESKSAEMGAARLLQYLEDTLSNTVQLTARRETMVEDFERALGRLYREHVQSRVQEYVTHLPRYSLAAAAGPFLENREVEAQGWEETPPGLKLARDMFVARISGHSMEPVIPDQSLCVFRLGLTGSRQGKLVLVEDLGGVNDRYTVKRYSSAKKQAPDGSWSHERVTLEPLNPAFEAWDLNPEEERFRMIAEFVRVLD